MNGAIHYIDLFCGLGAFRIASERAFRKRGFEGRCVFSCDIDPEVRKTYKANFGETPAGDIADLSEEDIPPHDALFAGFPCQPFSIIGDGKGFEDARGTLFFDIARILRAHRPPVFVLENVKRLVSHRSGATFGRIVESLESMGYRVAHKVLNALDFGLPQKRERVFIVGTLDPEPWSWPAGGAEIKPLNEVLEKTVHKKYLASPDIVNKRKAVHASGVEPSIWHQNKSGNVSSYPWSCALRAGASYNYLLVNGERRLTPREMLRLQGFPEEYRIVSSDHHMRRLAGNSIAIPVAEAVLDALAPVFAGNGRDTAASAG